MTPLVTDDLREFGLELPTGNVFQEVVDRLNLTQPFPPELFAPSEEPLILAPHQLCGRQHVIQFKKSIQGIDKGGGKTLTALSVFEDPLIHKNQAGYTVLILCPEKGMGSYLRDIQKFPGGPQNLRKIHTIKGSKAERARLWKNIPWEVRYILTTPSAFMSDSGWTLRGDEFSESVIPGWFWKKADGVIFDEFHRQYRGRKSKMGDLMLQLARNIPYYIHLSGSPMSRGPQDLFTALQISDRKFWSSYWNYVGTWNEVGKDYLGHMKVGSPIPSKMPAWQKATAPYFFLCDSKMMGDALPPITNSFLDVTLPPLLRRQYDDFKRRLFLEIDEESGEYLIAKNPLHLLIKLRQFLICPRSLSPQLGYGQAIEDIFDDARESELTRYAIYTPFRSPIPLLGDYLRGRGAEVFTLWGGIGLDEQERRLEGWRQAAARNDPNHPATIISTIKYAESWEIPQARYDYFLGAEYDPEDNRQAAARKRRLISTEPVFSNYVRHRGTIEEDVLEILLTKNENVLTSYKDWDALRNLLGN